MTIGILDDGIGVFSTYDKLKQAVCANFIIQLLDDSFPLSRASASALFNIGKKAIDNLTDMGCDVIVLSSAALSSLYKRFTSVSSVPLYSCDAPVMHACTYTASNVLVCCDGSYCRRHSLPNVMYCVMDNFSQIAETAQEQQIVDYIEQSVSCYVGQFDCVALAGSSMNTYKGCFRRVCPNVRIFDSLDGVARRIRKKYKRTSADDGFCRVINGKGDDISEKYRAFFE